MEPKAASASLELRREAEAWVVVAAGRWSLSARRPDRRPIEAALGAEPAGRLVFDTTQLGRWDAAFAVTVAALADTARQHGWEVDLGGLPESLPRLLDLRKEALPREADHAPDLGLLGRVGKLSLIFLAESRIAVRFLGEVVLAFFKWLRGRARWRRSDFWVVVEETGVAALPIITLISFLVGVIIAFLGAVVLQRFAADYYVSYLIGYGILREMGAIMAGIIMAGRTGAAFAAQIGSMKVTEEIDALRTFGLPPIEFLVLPRVLALGLMMPLLTVYADLVGILGGYIISMAMLELSPPQFLEGMLEAVNLSDFVLGIIKGTAFGLIVALSGCLRGLQCGSSADAVGRATTQAVVLGITLIIITTAIIDMVAAFTGV